ncbi:MAG: DUF1552 domain-containing protein [Bryobacteraceae bacterium]
MILTGKSLSRRTLLRGAGALAGLPALDAMFPAFAAKPKSPVRMAFLYAPNGKQMEEWTPRTTGEVAKLTAESLPRITQALAPYRDDVILFSGLTHNNGRALGDGPGDHGRAGASYLTGVHPKKTFGRDIRVGVSVDQIAAAKAGSKTRFASIEIGCEEGIQGGNCDNGYSCAYSNSVSWRTENAPLPPEIDPRSVFERLFGAGGLDPDPARRERQRRYERSILDHLMSDAHKLKSELGPTDRRKIDEYLFSIRDVEKRIAAREQQRVELPPDAARLGTAAPGEYSEHAKLMFDILLLAFQTDSTRVASFMLGIEQSNRAYREIGISESHHGLTHHRGEPEKIDACVRINRFHLDQFAYFLGKMKSTPDGDGSLLDHSMILYGCGLSDPNRHEHHNLPAVLAGRAGGALSPGRHLMYPNETPMANLFVTMLDVFGVPGEMLGDANGRLPQLTNL